MELDVRLLLLELPSIDLVIPGTPAVVKKGRISPMPSLTLYQILFLSRTLVLTGLGVTGSLPSCQRCYSRYMTTAASDSF